LALLPITAQAGDQICLVVPGSAFVIVFREVNGGDNNKVDDRVRSALKEPSDSTRRVRHVRMIGECFSNALISF